MKLGGRKKNIDLPAKSKVIRRAGGFTLIEILVDFVVVALVATAVISAFSAGYSAMGLAKAKIAAVALANEKMEDVRNMPYDELATEHGIIYPAGYILDDETINRKNISFNVQTVITYVDDPFDGCVPLNGAPPDECSKVVDPGKPVDLYPYDYKKVEITIYKKGRPIHLARLTSNVSAKAAETKSETGIIRICIIDSTGAPVSEATITIENYDVTPVVNMSAVTGMDGCIMVPNLPEDTHNNYHMTVTKDGYSTDMTYPRTSQNPNALYPDVNVLIQQITNQTLVIDLLSDMNIFVVNEAGIPVPQNTPVHMVGAKEIYFNPSTFKYDQTHQTDASGNIALTDIEFDDYSFEVSGYTIVTTSPHQPVPLIPGTTSNVTITVTLLSDIINIRTIDPTWAYESNTVYMTIWGQNFQPGVSVILQNGATQIVGTNVVVSVTGAPPEPIIEVEFAIPASSKAIYNLIVTNPAETPITQINAFQVFQIGDDVCSSPPCL